MNTLLKERAEQIGSSASQRSQNKGTYFLVKLFAEEVRFFEAKPDTIHLLESIPISKLGRYWQPSHFKTVMNRISLHTNNETVPMIVMGSKAMKEAFVQAATYPYIRLDQVNQELEETAADDLHTRATSISMQDDRRRQNLAKENYEKLKRKKGKTLSQVRSIAAAAADGQVQQLLVAKGQNYLAYLDQLTGEIFAKPGDGHETKVDVVDRVKRWVFHFSGEVYLVPQAELPGDSPMYAVLRW